jgi:hypothetical protein
MRVHVRGRQVNDADMRYVYVRMLPASRRTQGTLFTITFILLNFSCHHRSATQLAIKIFGPNPMQQEGIHASFTASHESLVRFFVLDGPPALIARRQEPWIAGMWTWTWSVDVEKCSGSIN